MPLFHCTCTRRPSLPDILVQVICWVLGEYSYLMGAEVIAEVCDQICEIAERTSATNSATRAYAITAVIKLTAQYGRATTSATALVLKYANSSNSDLQQRCYEFMELSKMPHMMREVLPVDASYEDLEVDASLSFLDGIVQAARDKGMPEYSKPTNDNEDSGFGMPEDPSGLNFAAYATPTVGNAAVVNGGLISGTSSSDMNTEEKNSGDGSGGGGNSADDMFNNLKVTKNVWGSSGFTGKAAGMNASANQNDNTDALGNVPGEFTSTPSTNNFSEQPIEASIVPNSYNDASSSSSSFSSSNEPTQTYTEPEPEPEPVISQREQEAMALFGGISSGSSGKKSSTGRTRTRRNRNRGGAPKQEEATVEQPVVAESSGGGGGGDDLLDLMGGGGSSSGGGGADDSVNMFADLGGGGEATDTSGGGGGGGGLLDMDDLMGGGMSNQTVQPVQPVGLVPGGLASTQEFGQLWMNPLNVGEITSQVTSFNVRTPEAFMECMSMKGNLQGIQAITQSKFN